MTTAIACCAWLGLLIFGLGFWVSMMRGRTQTVIGNAPDPADPLHKAVRAHANAAEYAPMLGVLMLALGAREPAGWVLTTMWVATASRFVHAAGMLLCPTLAKPHPLRFLGAVGTYVAGIALCVAALRAG